MRLLPDFIAELIPAANTIHKLMTRQRRRMLGRAYVEILEQYVKSNGETPQEDWTRQQSFFAPPGMSKI
jgi:hypothetical protein